MTRTSTCVVCHRLNGPGVLMFLPVDKHPDVELGIHERHRIMTIFRAGIQLRLVKKRKSKAG